MFDSERNYIGIAASSIEGEGHPVRKYPGSPPRAAISATAFLDHFDVPHAETKRWNARLSEEVLVVDLNSTPKVISRKRKPKGVPDTKVEESPI